MLDLALNLARQGFYVHPVKADKTPHLTAWQDRSTTDEDTIRSWWERYPNAIPAIHCGKSGLVVFDLEGVGKAHNDATPTQNAEALGLSAHSTLTVKTPSGGLHFYYRFSGDLPKAKLFLDGKFVGDRQAGNAYVLPAGADGYTVERGGAVKPLPEALLDVGGKPTGGSTKRRKNVGPGERNDYLISVVGGMRNWIDDLDELLEFAHMRNRKDCNPPLPEEEVDFMVRKAWKRWNPSGLDDVLGDPPKEKGKASLQPGAIDEVYSNTDLGNSQRFTARWGHACRFVHEWGRWITWDGVRWRPDTDGQAERWMVETLRACAQIEPKLHSDDDDARACRSWLKGSESRRRIEDALNLASTAPGMHVTPDDLDRKADLLNCPNGMVDLRTGELLPHDSEALCTLVTRAKYNPEARSERFDDFLREVFPDKLKTFGIVSNGEEYDDQGDTRSYVQRVFGYSLLGAPEREQCLFMHYGASASGKSTLLEAFSHALGDYQEPADVEAILARKRGQHPHDLAKLRGKRVVDTSELDSGERLSESVVKRVTAGERINARFMRQNLFTYLPTWVIHVTTNHGFTLGAGGASMERRIKVIPWTVSFAGTKRQDKTLRDTLKRESEAVLAWAVQGAIEYHQRGQDLEPSRAAIEVGSELFADADPVAAFVNDALVITGDDSHIVTNDALYSAFRVWWTASGRKGEPDYTRRAFGMALSRVQDMPPSTQVWNDGSNRRGRKGIRIQPEYTVGS